jgi:hypothetical protein
MDHRFPSTLDAAYTGQVSTTSFGRVLMKITYLLVTTILLKATTKWELAIIKKEPWLFGQKIDDSHR